MKYLVHFEVFLRKKKAICWIFTTGAVSSIHFFYFSINFFQLNFLVDHVFRIPFAFLYLIYKTKTSQLPEISLIDSDLKMTR